MTRAEALAAAEEYISKTQPAAPPLNSRGYPVDGWRPLPATERLAAVLRVAAFLLGEEYDA